MTQPDALDQSWGYADPATCQRLGIKLVSMYLSGDPSKNATAAKIKAYHAHGIGVWLNWEDFAGAALQGGSLGEAHGYAAAQQVKELIRQVGYAPSGRLVIPASYDFDSNAGQYPAIDAYAHGFQGQVNAQGFGAGAYGEADLIEHLHAAGLTEAEWQTYAWSGGRLSSEADLYQYRNGQTFAGASVDFNRIIHGSQIGAWWPPGDTALGGGTVLVIPGSTDWLDTMTPDELRTIVRDEVDRGLVALLTGKGNQSYAATSPLVDGAGLQGRLQLIAYGVLDPDTGARVKANQAAASAGNAEVRTAAAQKSLADLAGAVKALPAASGSVPANEVAAAVLDGLHTRLAA